MSKIAIVTDSNSGITQTEAKKLGVSVVPMPFFIDGELYLEDISLTQEQFYELLDCERQAMFVAEDDGIVIGFAHAVLMPVKNISCLKTQSNVYIQDMIVTENHRSCGIGSRLMSAVKEYGRQHNSDFVRTQVFPMNEDGLRFYQKNGFSITMLTIEAPLT